MQKAYKISDTLVYASITLSGVLYAGFLVSNQFYFRAGALFFAVIFYLLVGLFCLERRKELGEQIRHGSKGYFVLYLLLVLVPLFSSLEADPKSLLTVFFHPLAFLAFFIAIVALTVQDGTVTRLHRFARIANNLLPLAILFDLVYFKKPGFINEVNFFLLVELIFWRSLTTRRKLLLLSLVAIIVVVEVYFDNRMIALRLLAITGLYFAFEFLPFLQYKLLRLIMLVSGIAVLYLLSFHFESTFNIIADNIPNLNMDKTDTRTFLFDEFFDTFKGGDWLAGRGYLGTYFSPWFYEWQGDDGDFFQRFSLEVGVLEILLKGGLLLLVPFCLILVLALYKGFVQAKVNTVHFKFSVFLFVQFMITGVENSPMFTVNYMLIWLSIGIILFLVYEKKEAKKKPVRLMPVPVYQMEAR